MKQLLDFGALGLLALLRDLRLPTVIKDSFEVSARVLRSCLAHQFGHCCLHRLAACPPVETRRTSERYNQHAGLGDPRCLFWPWCWCRRRCRRGLWQGSDRRLHLPRHALRRPANCAECQPIRNQAACVCQLVAQLAFSPRRLTAAVVLEKQGQGFTVTQAALHQPDSGPEGCVVSTSAGNGRR
jgi:hypothetical protein